MVNELRQAESHLIDAANLLDGWTGENAVEERELAEVAQAVHAALGKLLDLLTVPYDGGAYEAAAARARSNDFAATGGRDWT